MTTRTARFRLSKMNRTQPLHSSSGTRSSHSSSVLVVDDDDAIRDTLRDVLEDEGYEVAVAKNGEEAMAVLRGPLPHPGLVLLDLMMPVMTGWEVLVALGESETLSKIPVVVVSAMCAPGCKAFLQKPVKLGKLLDVVAKYCTCAAA